MKQCPLREMIYPYILVALQLISLIYLLVSAPILPKGNGGILVESAGIFLGILSIFQNGIGNFNITPTIRQNGILVTHGIYRIIRHPMYLAQLLFTLPLMLEYFTYFRMAAWFILLAVLLSKIIYEEKQLMAHFENYKEYAANTRKLIPFIY